MHFYNSELKTLREMQPQGYSKYADQQNQIAAWFAFWMLQVFTLFILKKKMEKTEYDTFFPTDWILNLPGRFFADT